MDDSPYNLMPSEPDLLSGPGPIAPPAAPPKPKEPAGLRNFGDIDATRKAIYDNVYDAALNLKPVSNLKHTLSLRDVQWMDGDTFSKKDRKEAS